jgi:hypothetical protein
MGLTIIRLVAVKIRINVKLRTLLKHPIINDE